jgi:hypothetical protein
LSRVLIASLIWGALCKAGIGGIAWIPAAMLGGCVLAIAFGVMDLRKGKA